MHARLKVGAAFLALFLFGMWTAAGLPFISWHAASARAEPVAGTKAWAEVTLLRGVKPSGYVDPASGLLKNNTSATCSNSAPWLCSLYQPDRTLAPLKFWVGADGTITPAT